jgi:Ca2+-binding RTX toxin-like protein
MNANGDVGVAERDGANIEANGTQCQEATRFNLQDLFFLGTGGTSDVTAVISLRGGPFVPGFGAEPGGSDEMEFAGNLDFISASSGDLMVVRSGNGNERIRLGLTDDFGSPLTPVINLNAGESSGLDWDVNDVSPGTWDAAKATGGPGRDAISGAGGADTGVMLDVRLILLGGDDSDRLTGGHKGDRIVGGGGNDVLKGGPGPDVLNGGPGNDRCRGGPGADTLISC